METVSFSECALFPYANPLSRNGTFAGVNTGEDNEFIFSLVDALTMEKSTRERNRNRIGGTYSSTVMIQGQDV